MDSVNSGALYLHTDRAKPSGKEQAGVKVLRTLVGKEIRQWIRSFQWPAFTLILLFFAISDPVMTRYQDQLLKHFIGSTGTEMVALLPAPTAKQAIIQFMGDAAGLGAFVLILVSMGIIAQEREAGITEWILTRPVPKCTYVWAKSLTLTLGVTVALAVTVGVAYAYTWSLFSTLPSGWSLVWVTLGLLLRLLWVAAIVLLTSTLFRSSWAAAGVALLATVVESLIYALAGRGEWGHWLPYAATGQISKVMSLPQDAGLPHLWQVNGPSLLLTATGIVVLFGLTAAIFARQET